MTSSPVNRANPSQKALLFHSLEQAKFAIESSADLMPPPPLITAPGAAAFWGVGWFQAILNDLQIDDKDISHRIWLDCDDAAGQAATALNVGCQKLVFTGTGPALQTLINLAADQGAEVRQDRFDTFDLRQIDFNKPTSASLHAAKQKLRNWLQTS